MCMSSISNVIYHKFSLGGAFYMLNGKNVNVMLESVVIQDFSYEEKRFSSILQDGSTLKGIILIKKPIFVELQPSILS